VEEAWVPKVGVVDNHVGDGAGIDLRYVDGFRYVITVPVDIGHFLQTLGGRVTGDPSGEGQIGSTSSQMR
jgi:hypothetical protein